jgi:hypothetical protein
MAYLSLLHSLSHTQHSYEDTVKWYKNLATKFPRLMNFNPSIGQTVEHRDMPSVHFTGTKDQAVGDKKKFYMQCQIHASES